MSAQSDPESGADWDEGKDGYVEQDRKPRVERIMAAGRRAASDKAIVSPLKSRIRNMIIGVMLRLFGIPGLDRAYRYHIQWDAEGHCKSTLNGRRPACS